MTRRTALTICLAAAAIAAGVYAGSARLRAPQVGQRGWSEVAWPFLRDGWPNGRAFRCDAATCGAELSFYVRVKNGFCDCTRGVADDDEIDRVGDVDLVEPNFSPSETSIERNVSGIPGRQRRYTTGGKVPAYVATLAAGRNCNAIVAMLVASRPLSSEHTDAAASLLDTADLARWIEQRQGS